MEKLPRTLKKANVVIDTKWSDISELLTVTVTVTFSALINPRNLETCMEMSVMEV
jgi:hypothetical protein